VLTRVTSLIVTVLLVVALALLARWLLTPALGGAVPFITLFAAVAYLTWRAGWGAGVAATVLGYAGAMWLFAEMPDAPSLAPLRARVTLATYLLASGVVIVSVEAMRRREQRAMARLATKRAALAALSDAVIAVDTLGQVTTVNRSAERLTGLSAAELVGHPFDRVWHAVREPSGLSPPASPLAPVLLGAQRAELPLGLVLQARDGTRRPVEGEAAPILDAAGRSVGAVLVLRDVGERLQAERALIESSSLLRSMAASTSDLITVTDREGRLVFANPAARQAIALPDDAGAVPGNADEAEAMRHNDLHVMASGEATSIEEVHTTAEGQQRLFLATKTPLRDAQGAVSGVVSIARDITLRKRTEQALADSERGLRLALEAANMVAWRYDATAGGSHAGESRARAADLPAWRAVDTLMRRPARIHPDDAEAHRARVQRALDEGGSYATTYRVVGRDDGGVEHWIEERAQATRDTDGRRILTGVSMDVTERKLDALRLQAQQRELEADLAALGQLQALATRLVRRGERDTLLRDILRTGLQLTATSRGHVLSYEGEAREPQLAVHEGLSERFVAQLGLRGWAAACEAAVASGSARSETGARPVAGPPEELALQRAEGIGAAHATPLLSRDGRLLGVIGLLFEAPRHLTPRELRCLDVLGRMAADLLERAESERALRVADLRKDEFLATLAHELRNPLAPIRNAVELLQRERVPRLASTARVLERQVKQMIRLVDDLLDLSRVTRGQIDLQRSRQPLGPVVSQAIEGAGAVLRDMEHRLTVRLPREPLWVDADAQRLSQVIGNLLHNAGKYTDRGGRIELVVERRGDEVAIRVRDNGVGVAADQLARIFEMFVQADADRPQGNSGLGIGLTLARRLVHMHGGRIEAHSEGLGRGSEFVVTLPLAPAPAAAGAPLPPPPPPPAAEAPPRRILVVDDNVDGAQTLAELLRAMGHEAAVAGDGRDALEQAERLRPDLVLLDIGLPVMDGHAVCRHLRQQDWGREMPIVALTGWGQDRDRERSRESGFDAHLVKPAEPQALQDLFDRLWNPAPAAMPSAAG
jgi:signal transduction histidine kinase/CheY-like chemotaxis protein